MEDCNGLQTPTKVEAPLGTEVNVFESKRYWPNSYASVIGIMLYIASNTRPDISFVIHQCARFKHNPKVSHEIAVKRICSYLKGTKDNGLVFNPSKKLVVDCYSETDFAGIWGHEDLQDPICTRSRTGFVVTFVNCRLLWMSKLQTEITLCTLHSDYVAFSYSVRALLSLKSLIKKEIDNLGIDCENLKFVSSSTIYEDSNGSIVVATSSRMTLSSKYIAVKYQWFRQHVRKTFVIRKIESENQKANIFIKGLQGQIFVRISKLLCSWYAFR